MAGRVVLVTRNLPPLVGGMERLILQIARALNAKHALAVIGPRGCKRHLPAQTLVREVAHAPLPRFLAECLLAALRIGGGDALVFAGSGLTAPIAMLAARRSRAPWVVYLHGLDIVAASRTYRALWLPCIRRADLVLVNSRNTRDLAIANGIPAASIRILHPGTELPGRDEAAGQEFRRQYGLDGRPMMLSVGRLTPRKGAAEFVRDIMPAVLAACPDAILVLIGDDASHAVRASRGSERARIERAAEEAGIRRSVLFLQHCDDAGLSAAYNAADVHVFPGLAIAGDVEGFGMVAVEAAARGLPTVAFGVGGIPDAVVDGVTGSLVPAGDQAAFASDVVRFLGREDQPGTRSRCLRGAAGFGWDRFAKELHESLGGGFPGLRPEGSAP